MKITSNHILILTSEFPPLPGGIGNHAFNLSKYLQQSGYAISVITDYRNRAEDAVFDQQQDFKIIRIKRNPVTYLNRIIKGFSQVKKNETVIASGKFSLWLGALLRLFFAKKKYIAVLHGSELKAGGSFTQGFTKWSLSRFDKHIAVSNYTKNALLQIHPQLAITVINNGIEWKQYPNKLQPQNQSIQLITVGNLTQRKGQQNVIKALPLLKKSFADIHYHCVGIPSQKDHFSVLAKQLDVLKNLTFHGALSENDKNECLQKSSVFMMLSEKAGNDFEGFGIAVLEANALGLPAIGSKESGIADAIKDGFSGKLVHPHQPEEIRDALLEITANYDTFSKNAQEWAGNFNWKMVVKKYIEVIES